MNKETHKESLPLTLVPDPVLRVETAHLSEKEILSDQTQELIRKMHLTMKVEHGVGLAATQVGVSKHIAVIDAQDQQFTIINAEIIKGSAERVLFPEGCLSIPGQEYPIVRHEKITVRYLDAQAKQCKIKLRSLLAVVFQHEIDHLNGIVITDRHEEQERIRTDYF